MLVAQNSLGSVCPVPLTVRGNGNVTHPPDTPTPAGKYWGWCMWTITVPTSDLLKATNVACRAWDAAMNTQPKELTWNVMGMLNNPWFTVVKHFDYSEDGPVCPHAASTNARSHKNRRPRGLSRSDVGEAPIRHRRARHAQRTTSSSNT